MAIIHTKQIIILFKKEEEIDIVRQTDDIFLDHGFPPKKS